MLAKCCPNVGTQHPEDLPQQVATRVLGVEGQHAALRARQSGRAVAVPDLGCVFLLRRLGGRGMICQPTCPVRRIIRSFFFFFHAISTECHINFKKSLRKTMSSGNLFILDLLQLQLKFYALRFFFCSKNSPRKNERFPRSSAAKRSKNFSSALQNPEIII